MNADNLRLGDADDRDETLQEYENMEVREAHTSMGLKISTVSYVTGGPNANGTSSGYESDPRGKR